LLHIAILFERVQKALTYFPKFGSSRPHSLSED
jgi:hypothetical protein